MPSKSMLTPKPGRPPVINATATVVARLPPALVKAIDEWATTSRVNRSQAIRRLIELGLAKGGKR
jgi:metal-responsive CopG/Arc/MetJ family transcriptional regulator